MTIAPIERQELADRTKHGTPGRVLAVGLACLATASLASLAPAREGSHGLVWILALVPVFMLAYYRGWRGAALAAAAGMLALVLGEIVFIRLMGNEVDWRLFGAATAILVPITFGTGLLAELLGRQQAMALEMAYRDPLTNVANRRMLREHADKLLAGAGRDGTRVGFIFLDLIGFKRINDGLGHAAGDELLKQLSLRLVACCRRADIVARTGGDEFVVCAPGIASEEDLLSAARRLRDELGRSFHVSGRSVHVSGRFGVALYPDHGEELDELLSVADPATPGGKEVHEGITVPVPDAGGGTAATPLLETELQEAIDEGEGISVAFQPVFDPRRRETVGAEVFARLDHPEKGPIRAQDFIPLAEGCGLIRRLEQAVLNQAVREARGGTPSGNRGWVAVNLSPGTLQAPEFLPGLERLLSGAGVEPDRLVIEITERMAVRNFENIARVLRSLHAMGTRIAVDDFGTGHASLAYLARCEVDFLKLDMDFTAQIGVDARQERLIRGIMGLASGLGVPVIAEGVETREQFEWLVAHGCELLQGYYIGRPIAPRDGEGLRPDGTHASPPDSAAEHLASGW